MQPKAGIRTTEFWVTIIGAAGAVAAAAAGVLPPKYAAALMTISAVAYKLSRGLAKVGSLPQVKMAPGSDDMPTAEPPS